MSLSVVCLYACMLFCVCACAFSSILPCKLWWPQSSQTTDYIFNQVDCWAPAQLLLLVPQPENSPSSTLSNHMAHLVHFPSLRNHCLALPDVQYLKRMFHIFYLAFVVVSGGRVQPVFVPLSLPQVELKHLFFPYIFHFDKGKKKNNTQIFIQQLISLGH